MGSLLFACEDAEVPEVTDMVSSGGTTGGSTQTGGQSSATGGDVSTGGQIAEPTGEIIESADGESFELLSGEISMVVTRANGGRMVSFQVGQVETLVREGEAEYFGTVFWPSPQTWEWPPESSISEIDRGDYSAVVSDGSVTLTSAFNATVGISVTKKFTPLGNGSIVVEYGMSNSSGNVVRAAPWEISRVAEGLVFFPTGPAGVLEKSNLDVERLGGVTWYAYDPEGLPETPKHYEDGAEGWVAFAVPENSGGVLVVKTFVDLNSAQFAPEESEIELFASTQGQYFEVEHQGAYVEIAPGAHVTWSTTWRGARILNSPPTVGAQNYLESARELASN